MMKPRAHVHFVTGKQVDHFFFRFILSMHIPKKAQGMNQAGKNLKNRSRLYPKNIALEHNNELLYEVNNCLLAIKRLNGLYRKMPSLSRSLFSCSGDLK